MKILKKLFPIIGLIYFGLTCYGQTRGVSYDPTTTNVIQTVNQRFHALTNLSGTASVLAGYDANKKLGSFTKSQTLTFLGTGTQDSTTFLRGDGTWAVPPGTGGGSAPVGTMVNSGASTEFALPYYTDATGTNLAPSLITTDATKTNLNTGAVKANVLVLTNLSESLSNIGLGTEDTPQFTAIELSHASANTLTASGGTLSIEGAALATAASVALKANLSGGNTLGGAQLLSEGASIELDAAGSADGAWSGISRVGTAGATLAFGDLVYLDPTDSRWELADANSASGADGDSRGIIGICVLAAASDGSATRILLQGVVRADAVFPSLTINGPIYVSETAGDITQTSPTTEDNVVRILGAAWTADEIHFAPDRVWTVYDAP